MGTNNGKRRWKISIFRSKPENKTPPKEFICPISGSLMSDPVVISSGQTLERTSAQVCLDLGHVSHLDLQTLIPNLALKSTILKWCDTTRTPHPHPPDHASVAKTVNETMMRGREKVIGVSERELLQNMAEAPTRVVSHAATEMNGRVGRFDSSSSSVESVVVGVGGATPMLPFATRPMCFSPPSTSSETTDVSGGDDEEFVAKLRSSDIFELEQCLILLRKVTRTEEAARAPLCTPRLLSAVRPLLMSRYPAVCTNAAASVVNLSLEKQNKVKIVRSGMVVPLIDLLKGGGPSEAQEHAAGAVFSLALEDGNKTAIGVLGVLEPLLHALRCAQSGRTRCDSALALYHLSMVQSNRAKLVALGAAPALLAVARSQEAASGRAVLVLGNLAACGEGRAAMLEAGAVAAMVGMVGESESESTRENCVSVLYLLSHGSLRFKALAKEAGAREVLRGLEESGSSERMREKARKVRMAMRGREEEEAEEEVDWEGLLEGGVSRTRYRVVGKTNCGANSTEF